MNSCGGPNLRRLGMKAKARSIWPRQRQSDLPYAPCLRKVWPMMAARTAKRRTRTYTMLCALIVSCALALAATASEPARAESEQDVAWCKGQGNPTPEQQIGGCTALIEAGAGQGRERGLSYFRRAAAYLKRENFDSAIRDFGEGLALDPDNATAFYGRGLTYARRGDFAYARRDFDRAVALDAKSAIAYFNRGRVYFSEGDGDRAIQDYSAAIDIGPK